MPVRGGVAGGRVHGRLRLSVPSAGVRGMRYFNTAGPCVPTRHYMVPAQERLPRARGYIEQGQYFVVHAPRQTGKTTVLS
ncbi:hypothetical protein DNK55_16655 [Streptomyces sp. AC1-42T]|nr:hypothetical protein DNK55_16655 [Streptomyces sp. AC1-42T]